MYQSPVIKHAKSQEELEHLANKEKEAQISERHLDAAQRGYSSSTDHGRKILNAEAIEGSGLRWIDLLQLKITERREEVADNRRKPDWFKLLANYEKCVDMALSVSRTYSQGGTALDIAGWITLKSVVDGFGGNSSTNDWPVAASVAQRIGKAADRWPRAHGLLNERAWFGLITVDPRHP